MRGMLEGGGVQGGGEIKGRKNWENYNSKINKIHLKKEVQIGRYKISRECCEQCRKWRSQRTYVHDPRQELRDRIAGGNAGTGWRGPVGEKSSLWRFSNRSHLAGGLAILGPLALHNLLWEKQRYFLVALLGDHRALSMLMDRSWLSGFLREAAAWASSGFPVEVSGDRLCVLQAVSVPCSAGGEPCVPGSFLPLPVTSF